MTGFAVVIQLLAQAGRQFGVDLARVDGPVVSLVDGEDQFQLLEIGLDGGAHVRVLELAGEHPTVAAGRLVHLAE